MKAAGGEDAGGDVARPIITYKDSQWETYPWDQCVLRKSDILPASAGELLSHVGEVEDETVLLALV